VDVAARLEAVERENETLRERVAALEELLRGKEPPPIEFGLTGSEALVLGLLMSRGAVTKDAIMAVLYHNRGRDEAEVKIADVFICKIRKKLKPFGVEIATHWGRGWEMPEKSKQVVRGMSAKTEPRAA
jgi:two-component system, cell cycle response regulator CtrA